MQSYKSQVINMWCEQDVWQFAQTSVLYAARDMYCTYGGICDLWNVDCEHFILATGSIHLIPQLSVQPGPLGALLFKHRRSSVPPWYCIAAATGFQAHTHRLQTKGPNSDMIRLQDSSCYWLVLHNTMRRRDELWLSGSRFHLLLHWNRFSACGYDDETLSGV